MRFRRRIYTRGSSYETTIPKPLLFEMKDPRGQDILFEYDSERKRWYVVFEKRTNSMKNKNDKKNKNGKNGWGGGD